MYPHKDRKPAHSGSVEYVVAETPQAKPKDQSDNPCRSGSSEECAEWVRERLMALYNE